MSEIEEELAAQLGRVRRERELVPCLLRLLSAEEVSWRVLPPEMLQLLCCSPDFRQPLPGAPAVTLQVSAGDQAAELVLYRATADGVVYVLAPGADDDWADGGR